MRQPPIRLWCFHAGTPHEAEASGTLTLVLAAATIMWMGKWFYGLPGRRILDERLAPDFPRQMTWRYGLAALAQLVAVPLAMAAPRAGGAGARRGRLVRASPAAAALPSGAGPRPAGEVGALGSRLPYLRPIVGRCPERRGRAERLMALVFLLAFQSAVAAAAPVAAVDFDLARRPPRERGLLWRERGCARQGGDDILVCGARPSGGDYPMDEMAREFAERPIRAEARIAGNLVGDVHGETVILDRGAVSHRAMVRLRLPF